MTVRIDSDSRVKLRYLLVVLSAYPLFRLLSSISFVWLFSQINLAEWNRIPDMRLVPHQTQQAGLRFLMREAKIQGRNRSFVLVSGDSQMYAHTMPATEAVAAVIQKELPGTTVVNAAKLGATYLWVRQVLDAALSEGYAPDVLVFNTNPSMNAIALEEKQFAPDNLLYSLLLSNETAGTLLKVVGEDFFFKGPYQADGKFNVVKLPSDYLPKSLNREVESAFKSVLDLSVGKVRTVVVVLGPHYYTPYNRPPYNYGWDTARIVSQYKEICRSYKHTVCLDVSTAYALEYFHDVVHLNRDGHRTMGIEIANVIRSNKAQSDVRNELRQPVPGRLP